MTEAKTKVNAKEKNEAFFYDGIYKAAKMSADTVLNLLPHIRDDGLRSVVTMQLDGYEKYAQRAAEALQDAGLMAKEEGFVTRMTAKVGAALHTMLDSGTSHVAEMMIEGSNLCITDMIKLLNDRELCDCAPGAMRLAREVVAFEEHNLEMLKRYL